ncbi:MAG: flagellar basal body-associated FliL family protein [Candidatus Acidiferrales bacterium]
MAQAPVAAPDAPKKPKKKSRGKKPLLVVAALLCIGLVAGGWLWHRSASAQSKPTDANVTEVKSVLHLESFVVNLQGSDSDTGYLRVGIDLGLGVAAQVDGDKDVIAPLRDTILTVLGTENVGDLLTPTGKAKLKDQILAAIQQRLPDIQCRDVYFTEFLVQH